MAYLQFFPKESPNTKASKPLRITIGRKLQPSTIENRSSVRTTSIGKENPSPQEDQFPKNLENVINVERKVISARSVELRPNPLSIPSLVTNPAKMKSLNS